MTNRARRVALLLPCALSALAAVSCEETEAPTQMSVTSPAFTEGEAIPTRHTCYGIDASFPLRFSGAPLEARCLTVQLEDVDHPEGPTTTWIVWNVPAESVAVDQDGMKWIDEAVIGANDAGLNKFNGPCRDPAATGYERRRYALTVRALDLCLSLEDSAGEREVERASSGHVLAEGTLNGLYRWY